MSGVVNSDPTVGSGRCRIDTAIGPVSLGWSATAVRSVRLPGGPSTHRVRADVRGRPAFVVRAAAGMQALLTGERVDLIDVPVDFGAAGEFELAVYAVCRSIEVGDTLTYGQIAARLGRPLGAQAVGRAMARNPVPVIVPCHRVVGTGWLGGFSGAGGPSTKRRILQIEAAHSRAPVQTALPI